MNPQSSCNECNECGSTEEVEEDVDNEGCWYCNSCWERFELNEQQQQQHQQQSQGQEVTEQIFWTPQPQQESMQEEVVVGDDGASTDVDFGGKLEASLASGDGEANVKEQKGDEENRTEKNVEDDNDVADLEGGRNTDILAGNERDASDDLAINEDGGGGTPSQRDAKSPPNTISTSESLPKLDDMMSTALLPSALGANGIDFDNTFCNNRVAAIEGSSAYQGLTEEDDEGKPAGSTVNGLDSDEAMEHELQQLQDEEEEVAGHSGPKNESANANEVLWECDNEFASSPKKKSLDVEIAADAKPQSEERPDSKKAASEEDIANKMDIDDAEVLERFANQEGGGLARDHENTANEKHDDNNGSHIGGQSGEEDEITEGSRDTEVTTGLSSAGLSLYGSDTQMLPTGPSQILADQEGVPATESLSKDVEHQVVNEKAASGGVDKAVNEEAYHISPMAESMEHDASKKGTQKLNKTLVEEGMKEPADAEMNQGTQKLNKPLVEEGLKESADAEMNQERIIEERVQRLKSQENLAYLDNMKHTPENGSLSSSYPNDHRASPAKKQVPCEKGSPQCKNMEIERSDDDVGDDEEGAQMSKVLLSVSPARSSKDGFSEKSLGHAKSVLNNECNVLKDPPAQPEANSLLKNNNEQVFEEYNEDNPSRNGKVAEKGKLNNSKSLPSCQRKTAISETESIFSSRHAHGKNQDVTDNNNSGGSSPRLLVPSYKPTHKNSYNKATTSPGDGVGADDHSDNEPWPGNGHNYNNSDSIEDTQENDREVKRRSAFKRLSPGCSSQSSETNHDDDFSSTFHRSNKQNSKSIGSTRAKKDIQPRVLRYQTVSSSSSSEVEVVEDYANATKCQQSQTDQQIMKQLEEVEGMVSQLPSAREFEEMASCEQLMEEIAELKKIHKSEITKLNRKNCRLATQLITAKDAMKQKDRVIEQQHQALRNKSNLLDKQYEVIEKIKEKAQGLANGKSNSTSSTKHTPPAAASTRKKKNVEQLTRAIDGERTQPPLGKGSKRKKNAETLMLVGSDTSDSNDDSDNSDDEVPISALKNRNYVGSKKQRKDNNGKNDTHISPPPLDDSKLCGKIKLLTLESAQASINLVVDFVRGEYHGQFISALFTPLWDRLKDQGSSSADATDSILNWKNRPYRSTLSGRSWCYVPPSGCSMGASKGKKGVLGIDYFLSEEQVVLCVLKEVSAMKEPEIYRLHADHAESFEEILPVLTRAVYENMEYK